MYVAPKGATFHPITPPKALRRRNCFGPYHHLGWDGFCVHSLYGILSGMGRYWWFPHDGMVVGWDGVYGRPWVPSHKHHPITTTAKSETPAAMRCWVCQHLPSHQIYRHSFASKKTKRGGGGGGCGAFRRVRLSSCCHPWYHSVENKRRARVKPRSQLNQA